LVERIWAKTHLDLFGDDRFPAFGTDQYRIENLAAFFVAMQNRAPALVHFMHVAPMNEREDRRVKIEPSLREEIFIAGRPFVIRHAAQDAMIDELAQPRGEHVPGHAEPRLEILKATDAQKAISENEQGPAVADDGDRARERTILFVQVIPSHQVFLAEVEARSRIAAFTRVGPCLSDKVPI
jgi:hypothetical protein